MLGVIITLVFVGVLLWAVNTYVPMDGKIKQILNVVVVLMLLLYLFAALTGHAPVFRIR